jgi:hypothetical protein
MDRRGALMPDRRDVGVILPNFLIVGAMRCGTTSLHSFLSTVPGVFVAKRKEIHFFDSDDAYAKGLPWYASWFEDGAGSIAIGESTQTYMYDPVATERMAAALPDARLVVSLRDPVDRAYSHYWHNVERGRESLSFEDALRAEDERLHTLDRETARRFAYVDRGRYASQLERLATKYERDAIKVIAFEDLTSRPADVLTSLCRYLGVDAPSRPVAVPHVNAFIEIRSRRLRDATRRLPERLRDAVARLNTHASSYPPMHPRTRRALVRGFEDENARLGEWLGSGSTAGWRTR